jgi:hypothetical protein
MADIPGRSCSKVKSVIQLLAVGSADSRLAVTVRRPCFQASHVMIAVVAPQGGWIWNEGWLLASVVIAQRSEHSDLAGIIGVADYINRQIASREEIESAVNHLPSTNLLDPVDPLNSTPLAEELWQRAKGDRGLVASVRRLVELLNHEDLEANEVGRWSLSQEEYGGAVVLYCRRFDEAVQRHNDN